MHTLKLTTKSSPPDPAENGRFSFEDDSFEDDPTELSPLFSPTTEREDGFRQFSHYHRFRTPKAITWAFLMVVLLFSCGIQLRGNPQTRIIESIICYRYYERTDPSKIQLGREDVGPGAIGGVAEMWCKVDAVQSELAAVGGWQIFLNGFPGLLLAIPFGWAADKFGRKPFLVLGGLSFVFQAVWVQAITWFWQAFDIRMIWLSTIFSLMSGGGSVVVSLLFVALSDVTPAAGRATIFVRVGAFNLLAALVMPAFSAWLMIYSPWIPSIGGTFMELAGIALLVFIPETLKYHRTSNLVDLDLPSPSTGSTSASQRPSLSLVAEGFSNLKTAAILVSRDLRVPLLIFLFFADAFAGQSNNLALQYVSKRYRVTISQSTLLLTVRHIFTAVTLLVMLPLASRVLTNNFRLSSTKKDLYLAWGSEVFLAVGLTLLGLSHNIPSAAASLTIASFGSAAMFMVRSLLTSMVPTKQTARIHSVVSVAETLGGMLGSPVMAIVFSRGLRLGGGWLGLPFYVTGLVSGVSVVILFAMPATDMDYQHRAEASSV